MVATDEHDENSVLISDEFTNPLKRRMMVEKRARKFRDIVTAIAPPELEGAADAEITLVGWGSTYGGYQGGHWAVGGKGALRRTSCPSSGLFLSTATPLPKSCPRPRRVIIVENNYSGQFLPLYAQ